MYEDMLKSIQKQTEDIIAKVKFMKLWKYKPSEGVGTDFSLSLSSGGYFYVCTAKPSENEAYVTAQREEEGNVPKGGEVEIFRQGVKCCPTHLIFDAMDAVLRHIALKAGGEVPNPTSPWRH